MRISEHLYMLSGAPYGQTGNVYAIRGETDFFMIDCGRDKEALDVIRENLLYYGFTPAIPSCLLITHAHFDHSGNAWYFQKQGSEVACHTLEAGALEQGGELVTDYACKDIFQTCPVLRRFQGGEVISVCGTSVTVIHTPGHSSGSVLYQIELDGKAMLFTGDTISTELLGWGDLEAALGWQGGYDFNKALYLETLHRIYHLDADYILPGHGIPALCHGTQILKSAYCKGLLSLR